MLASHSQALASPRSTLTPHLAVLLSLRSLLKLFQVGGSYPLASFEYFKSPRDLVDHQTDFDLSIFQTMKSLKLQCLSSIFSMLLQNLCNKSQSDVARRLCKGAIAENYYTCPLVQGDLFEVALPPGLVEVEVHLLLEDHLRRVVKDLEGREMRPLVVHFSAGIYILSLVLRLLLASLGMRPVPVVVCRLRTCLDDSCSSRI